MKVLRDIVGLGVIGGFLAGSAHAGKYQDFVEEAHRRGLEVIFVPDGERLWDSTEHLLDVNADPCSPRALQTLVANANNVIARDTAAVAEATNWIVLRDYMRDDSQSFVVDAGKTCKDARLVEQADGVFADQAKKYFGENGSHPIAVNRKYIGTCKPKAQELAQPEAQVVVPEAPLVVVPEVEVPKEVPKGKEKIVYPLRTGIAGGAHYVVEHGEAASLAGPGLWLEGRADGKFAVNMDNLYLTRLSGEHGNASVVDFDGSLGYGIGDKLLVIPSVNFDLRTAGLRYADSEASESDITVSPQIRLVYTTPQVNLEGALAYSLLGKQTDMVEERVISTNQLTRAKAQLEGAYRLSDRFVLGGRAEVEISRLDVESANGDYVPRSSVRTTWGPRAEVDLTDRVHLIVGVEDTGLLGTGQETGSLRPYVGVGSR